MIIKDEPEVGAVVEHSGEKAGESLAAFADFKSKMPIDQPRWAIFNLEWKSDDSRVINKLAFINYCPDSCTNAKLKMKIA